MANSDHESDVDLLALLALVHKSSPEDLREGHMAEALNALEGAHRKAARALRDLNTAGLRRKRLPPNAEEMRADVPTSTQTPAPAGPVVTDVNGDAGGACAPDITVQSGMGADIEVEQRTLTHIVRPNRGRR